MFITSKNKYLLNDMKIFGTCSIPLNKLGVRISYTCQASNFKCSAHCEWPYIVGIRVEPLVHVCNLNKDNSQNQ